jgi:hypothetical protein
MDKDMNNRFEFLVDTFKGVGLGLTFGYEYKIKKMIIFVL